MMMQSRFKAILALAFTLPTQIRTQTVLCSDGITTGYTDAPSLAVDLVTATGGNTYVICPNTTIDIGDGGLFVSQSNTALVCDNCVVTSTGDIRAPFIVQNEVETPTNITFSGITFSGFIGDGITSTGQPFLLVDATVPGNNPVVDGDVLIEDCTFKVRNSRPFEHCCIRQKDAKCDVCACTYMHVQPIKTMFDHASLYLLFHLNKQDNLSINSTIFGFAANVIIRNSVFANNTAMNDKVVTGFVGTFEMESCDFHDNNGIIVGIAFFGSLTMKDSCFVDNISPALAYADAETGGFLNYQENNYADNPDMDPVMSCSGVFTPVTDQCSLFQATSCRGDPSEPAPTCYTDKNLAGSIYANSSVTGLYTVCAGTVFEDLLVITRSDIMIECEDSQTCTIQGSSFSPSLYVVNDEELGTITSNVTISGMVFTGYTGEDFIVGIASDNVHFRDCVFTVSYNYARGLIFMCVFSKANRSRNKYNSARL